jgi:hypothetical protein
MSGGAGVAAGTAAAAAQQPAAAAAASAGAGTAAVSGGGGSSAVTAGAAAESGWHCSQVFSGHSNSKHFVGLSTQGPFIACGSETNEVFVYHQGLPRPRMQCMLLAGDEARPSGSNSGSRPGAAAAAGATNSGGVSGSGKSPFVSAVCWRRDSNVLLAANSRGGVWVLSLVTGGGGPGGSVQ